MKEELALTNENGRRVGESHPKARLSDDQVDSILDMHENGSSASEIASKFKISPRHVRRICKFETRNQIMVSRKKRP